MKCGKKRERFKTRINKNYLKKHRIFSIERAGFCKCFSTSDTPSVLLETDGRGRKIRVGYGLEKMRKMSDSICSYRKEDADQQCVTKRMPTEHFMSRGSQHQKARKDREACREKIL